MREKTKLLYIRRGGGMSLLPNTKTTTTTMGNYSKWYLFSYINCVVTNPTQFWKLSEVSTLVLVKFHFF